MLKEREKRRKRSENIKKMCFDEFLALLNMYINRNNRYLKVRKDIYQL